MEHQLHKQKKILVTGGAGFIGFYLSKALIETNQEVIAVDNLNDYYDVGLKLARLEMINDLPGFTFLKCDLADQKSVSAIFEQYQPDIVVNLGAQAGVRYSISNPQAYMDSNITGFFNILENCRHSYANGKNPVQHLVYASSSSVYGLNKKVPYSVRDQVDCPVSLYAATKKSNELMAHAYAKLYGIPATGLRFFTVYGPMGRPDMAYYSFTGKMVRGEKIQIFNYGDMYRDFTYIDDIITGILAVLKQAPAPNVDHIPYKIYNIGNNQPESLLHFVDTLETCLLEEGVIKKSVEREFLPMQPGDVYQTYADIEDLKRDFGFCPKTGLDEGLRSFAKWFKKYYGSNHLF